VYKKSFSFKDSNQYDDSDITLIVGNNGSGKSSLLQAIVLVTATAAREGFTIENFDWPGFDHKFIQTGRFPLSIKCDYDFNPDEIKATKEFAEDLIKIGVPLGTPAKYNKIQLAYDLSKQKAITKLGPNAYYQFSGYQFAKRLTKYVDEKNLLFNRVGNIYWYTEQRTSYSISNKLDTETLQLDWMRSFLATAYSFHIAVTETGRSLKKGEFDFYDDLHILYKTIFPKRFFVGAAPNFDAFENVNSPDFFLSDGNNQYEISEMSAGERAIFPILLDFARWNINNSIIIIDEVELHLHPPLQQAFIRALNKLGRNNQFILTTHSENVVSMFEEDQIIRLQ